MSTVDLKTEPANDAGKSSGFENVMKAVADIGDKFEKVGSRLDAIEKAAKTPAAGQWIPGAPGAVIGGFSKDSNYSFLKLIGVAAGKMDPEKAKYEVEVSKHLKRIYARDGWQPSTSMGSFLAPTDVNDLQCRELNSEDERFVSEIKQKMCPSGSEFEFDHDQARWLTSKGYRSKALGSVSDIAGGSLVGFPTLGQLVDLQRNMEVFSQAGATQVALGSNGMINFPKLTGATTANWVGEAAAATESTNATGDLALIAKKLAVLTTINNELLRFVNPTVEAMVRNDMATVAALKADLAMLEGTGGTQIKGLITYDSQSSWTFGVDKIIKLVSTGAATNGDIFNAKDLRRLADALPDGIELSQLVMRKDMFTKISNLRADAVSAADAAGPFVFDITRSMQDQLPPRLNDIPVIRSSQVSGARVKGSGTTLTYILGGRFSDWLIGRVGVMEFLANPYSATPYTQDQTQIRGIQMLDAGARHAASFVWMDSLDRS
jgi:HK97 family phage major capsid protein